MRLQLTFLIMAVVVVQSPLVRADLEERGLAMPEVKLINEGTISGRKVVRYEHVSGEQWGYATPQRDYFHFEHLRIRRD